METNRGRDIRKKTVIKSRKLLLIRETEWKFSCSMRVKATWANDSKDVPESESIRRTNKKSVKEKNNSEIASRPKKERVINKA